MNKREKMLWLLLCIIILTIGIIIYIVWINNKKNDVNVNEHGNNNIEDIVYYNKIKGYRWQYLNSYFYDNNGSLPAIFDAFNLEFAETKVKICFEDNCSITNYEIDKDILTIKSIFAGTYVISFEGDYLFLEYTYENGSKIKFCFANPVG